MVQSYRVLYINQENMNSNLRQYALGKSRAQNSQVYLRSILIYLWGLSELYQ